MTDQDKPRICEVLCSELGVEPGEEWMLGGTKYTVRPSDGMIYFEHEKDDWWKEDDIETYAFLIEHKARIIRKPRFTPDEMTVLRYLASLGVTTIEKKSNTHIYWDGADMGVVMVVPPDFLASLCPAQDIVLKDVLASDPGAGT